MVEAKEKVLNLPLHVLESPRRVDEAEAVIELQPKVPAFHVRALEAELQDARFPP